MSVLKVDDALSDWDGDPKTKSFIRKIASKNTSAEEFLGEKCQKKLLDQYEKASPQPCSHDQLEKCVTHMKRRSGLLGLDTLDSAYCSQQSIQSAGSRKSPAAAQNETYSKNRMSTQQPHLYQDSTKTMQPAQNLAMPPEQQLSRQERPGGDPRRMPPLPLPVTPAATPEFDLRPPPQPPPLPPLPQRPRRSPPAAAPASGQSGGININGDNNNVVLIAQSL